MATLCGQLDHRRTAQGLSRSLLKWAQGWGSPGRKNRKLCVGHAGTLVSVSRKLQKDTTWKKRILTWPRLQDHVPDLWTFTDVFTLTPAHPQPTPGNLESLFSPATSLRCPLLRKLNIMFVLKEKCLKEFSLSKIYWKVQLEPRGNKLNSNSNRHVRLTHVCF